jgi:hypothetical protein
MCFIELASLENLTIRQDLSDISGGSDNAAMRSGFNPHR